MSDPRPLAVYRRCFDTRASVLAVWFISVAAIWPMLTLVISATGLIVMAMVMTTLNPELEEPGGGAGMFMAFVVFPPMLLLSAVVAAIACYKICRYMTVPLNESKPLACERGALIAVLVVVTAWSALLLWVKYRSLWFDLVGA